MLTNERTNQQTRRIAIPPRGGNKKLKKNNDGARKKTVIKIFDVAYLAIGV